MPLNGEVLLHDESVTPGRAHSRAVIHSAPLQWGRLVPSFYCNPGISIMPQVNPPLVSDLHETRGVLPVDPHIASRSPWAKRTPLAHPPWPYTGGCLYWSRYQVLNWSSKNSELLSKFGWEFANTPIQNPTGCGFAIQRRSVTKQGGGSPADKSWAWQNHGFQHIQHIYVYGGSNFAWGSPPLIIFFGSDWSFGGFSVSSFT